MERLWLALSEFILVIGLHPDTPSLPSIPQRLARHIAPIQVDRG
jgi:hypothetical protein